MLDLPRSVLVGGLEGNYKFNRPDGYSVRLNRGQSVTAWTTTGTEMVRIGNLPEDPRQAVAQLALVRN
jgi:hypothetical protein